MEQQVSKIKNTPSSLHQQLKEVSDSLRNFSPSRAEAENLREQIQGLLTRLDEQQK